MKPTAVLTAAYPPIARELLSAEFEVVEHPTENRRSEAEMITLLSEADAAITLLTDPITRRVLESNRNLRIVANYAVGYNNIDLAAARELGVAVTNTPDVLTEATADLTMALILAVTRRLVEGDRELRRTAFCPWEPMSMLGTSLQGKRLGIVGMGRIGSAVRERAMAFGMEVVHHSRSSGIPLDELLTTSDVVTLHTPLTGQTRHLIDPAAIRKMKRGSYLVNTSRGAVVDEEALCAGLEEGLLRGAALDVYEHEPAVPARLIALPNVVLAPHIGSATEEARNGMARLAAEALLRYFRGQPMPNRID